MLVREDVVLFCGQVGDEAGPVVVRHAVPRWECRTGHCRAKATTHPTFMVSADRAGPDGHPSRLHGWSLGRRRCMRRAGPGERSWLP